MKATRKKQKGWFSSGSR